MKNSFESLEAKETDLGYWTRVFLSKIFFMVSLCLMVLGLLVLFPVAWQYHQMRKVNEIAKAIEKIRYVHGMREGYTSRIDLHLLYDASGQLEKGRLNLETPRLPSPWTILWDAEGARVWLTQEKAIVEVRPEEIRELMARYSTDVLGETRRLLAAVRQPGPARIQSKIRDAEILLSMRGPEFVTRGTFSAKTNLPIAINHYGYSSYSHMDRRLSVLECSERAPSPEIFSPEFPTDIKGLQGLEAIRDIYPDLSLSFTPYYSGQRPDPQTPRTSTRPAVERRS